tara:strand:- start:1552 stop:4029 length:2478 start_codon:yes stop_codon:yes gene_type:complete
MVNDGESELRIGRDIKLYKIDNMIQLTEKFDLTNLIKLLHSPLIDDEWKSRMEKYKKHSRDCKVPVSYQVNDIGRLTIKATGLKKDQTLTTGSCMKGICKSAIFGQSYVDIDIVNSHPHMLYQIFKSKDYECPVLCYYVENRDKFFTKCQRDYQMDRDSVKVLVVRIFYGGSVNTFREENPDLIVPKIFDDMKTEMTINCKKLLSENYMIKYRVKAQEVKGEDDKNLDGTAMSYYLQTLECNTLLSMYKYLRSKGYFIGSLIHDGLHLQIPAKYLPSRGMEEEEVASLKSEADEHYNDLCRRLSIQIKIDTGFDLGVKKKDFCDIKGLDNIIVVDSDKEAGDYITEKIKTEYVVCKERIFMRVNDLWSSNDKTIKRGLVKKIANTTIVMDDQLYSKMNRGVNNIIPFVEPTEDDDFIDNLWSSNLGKLCFKNGYWDFKSNSLKPYDEATLTTIKINRDYAPSSDEDKYAVMKRIFMPIFNNDMELLSTWLNYIARGLAGHVEDKNWSVGIGERDCGKGVLGGGLENCFGDYVRATNSENFMFKAGQQDSAKALSWLVPFEFKRLLLTNEITKDSENKYRINGNVLKKLASGGDKIEARVNHKDEINFKIQARPVMFCNDLPPIEPSDAKETSYCFRYPSKFVAEDDDRLKNPIWRDKYHIVDDEIIYDLDKDGNRIKINVCNFYPKDDSIKEWLKKPEIMNAFIDLIFEAYGVKKKLPESMREEQDDFTEEETDESKFNLLFNFIGGEGWCEGEKDWCSIEQVNYMLRKAGINASPQKYKNWMYKNGACKCKRLDDSSNKRVGAWVNIQLNQGSKDKLDEGCLVD